MRNWFVSMTGVGLFLLLTGCAGDGRHYISLYEYEHGYLPGPKPTPTPVSESTIPESETPDTMSMEVLAPRAEPTPEPTPVVMEHSLVTPAAPDEPCTVVYRPPGPKAPDMEKVLVRPAHLVTNVIPAEVEWVEEQVLLRPEREVLKVIPAEFEWIDDAMSPEGRRKIVVKPAETERVTEPAEYRTVKQRKVLVPERHEVKEMPAQYKEIVRSRNGDQEQVIPVVCPEDVTPELIRAVQASLKASGFNPGRVDGRWANGTIDALTRYQLSHGLAPVGLSYPTLEVLGIK